MQYLKDNDEKEAIEYMNICAEVAKKATCLRSKCGCVIVKDNEVIGMGYNCPPKELESQRRCTVDKNTYNKKVTDKTCCMHAEHKAIINALKTNANKIDGSRLYFMRLDKEGNAKKSGKPYCTICSKFALDSGIKEFVLWHKEGICVYNTEEYNTLSYQYNED